MAALVAASPSDAQGLCGPRKSFIATLEQQHGETPKMIGVTQDNAVIELLANPESGTWTALVTHVNGVSCVLSSGQGFAQIVRKAEVGS